MARYTGPKDRISRRFNVPIFGSNKTLERKNYPPGIHGPKGSRRKQSEYSVALAEKQKLRYQYGILERQFRRYFAEAERRKGNTGATLLQLLESRLDNVVYRMGFGSTRAEARQLVSHCAVMVNGSAVNIPSIQVKPGDVIAIREKAKKQTRIQESLNLVQQTSAVNWVSVDAAKLEGTFKQVPDRDEISGEINESLIVELYSR